MAEGNLQASAANTAALSQLDTFAKTRSKFVTVDYSRSRDPKHPSISKQDDVTRFNSFNHRVAFYKNYPNRSGTPIKIDRPQTKKAYRKSVSPRVHQLQRYFEQSGTHNPELFKQALNADLRAQRNMPSINAHPSGPVSFVMNDYHNKETNPGFARNDMGGFYTR